MGAIVGGTIALPVPLAAIPSSFTPPLVTPVDGSIFFSSDQRFEGAQQMEFQTFVINLVVQPFQSLTTLTDSFVSVTLGFEYDDK